MTAFTLTLKPLLKLNDQEFEQLCHLNPDVQFERNSNGALIIMPPTGGETGRQNSELTADFVVWNRAAKLGVVFDSSTCFRLPNGALRSPDVAWISQMRWEQLAPAQQAKFPPLCPDFVLELRSPSDDLPQIQAKLREYLENGARLGWLLNPQDRQVEIYRADGSVEVLTAPSLLLGETLMPGFELSLDWFWSATRR